MIQAFLNLYVAPMPPIKFLSQSDLRFGKRCRLKNFKNLGYRNGTILAILNLCNAPMPPIKFGLNLTSGFGGDVI